MHLNIDLPSEGDTHTAETAVRLLSAFMGKQTLMHFQADEDTTEVSVNLPPEALNLLVRILAHMANGDGVTLVPVQAEVTTQQAADLLNVSHPYLIKLLEEGKVPHHKVGSHRRVPLRSLLAFKQQDDTERKAIADMLTADAQVLGLGY